MNSVHSKSYRWQFIIYDAAFHDPYLKKKKLLKILNEFSKLLPHHNHLFNVLKPL